VEPDFNSPSPLRQLGKSLEISHKKAAELLETAAENLVDENNEVAQAGVKSFCCGALDMTEKKRSSGAVAQTILAQAMGVAHA
jgi:hypothetical protein